MYVSDRSLPTTGVSHTRDARGNLHHIPGIKKVADDGTFVCTDDSRVEDIDLLIYCTGYQYNIPFLKDCVVVDKEKAVLNVYQHVFCNDEPSLSFVGLPWSVVPFHLFLLQAKWIASVYAGESSLPSKAERNDWLAERLRTLISEHAYPDRYHYLGDQQWAYCRFLARSAGCLSQKEEMYLKVSEEIYNHNKQLFPAYPGGPDSYRRRRYAVDRKEGTWSLDS